MEDSITGQDIIIIGQQPWDTEIGSNCKNIALELSKNNRVLYVNSPLDRISAFRGKQDPKVQKRLDVIHGKTGGLVKIQENLWNFFPDCIVESINWLNNKSIFNYLNKRNNRKFAISIQKAIGTLNFKKIVLFNDNEIFKGFYLTDFLKPALGIYYSRDYMLGVEYWKKHGTLLEPLLIEKNDFCFSNSEYLAEYCRKYNPNSYNIGQGCDVDDYMNVPDLKPADLKDLNGSLIGYVGSLNSARLSIEIIMEIAKAFPQMYVVLVGPEDENFRLSKLHEMQNVIFTGQKQVEELPSYINAFDVCINPQLLNEITIGNYPRKIDEYLALGKPVVATMTKTMEAFKEFVYLAEDAPAYIDLIKRAVEEHTDNLKKERIEFALSHTWAQSMKLMAKYINPQLVK
jgi:teichuronic acid biosynthesis glycosyltransferase TuaH